MKRILILTTTRYLLSVFIIVTFSGPIFSQNLRVKRTIQVSPFLPEKANMLSVVQNKETKNLHILSGLKRDYTVMEYDPIENKIISSNTVTDIKTGLYGGVGLTPDGKTMYLQQWSKKTNSLKYTAWNNQGEEIEFDLDEFREVNDKNEYYSIRLISTDGESGNVYASIANNTIDIHDANTDEVKETWTPPDLEVIRYQPIGGQQAKFVRSGISNYQIPYSRNSPWGRPIIGVANRINLLIYDAETKELLQRVRFTDKCSCDFIGGKILTTFITGVTFSQLGRYAYIYGSFPDLSKKKRRYGFKIVDLESGQVKYSAYKTYIPFGTLNERFELFGLSHDAVKKDEI